MMHIGCCTNCNRDYRNYGMKEFLGKLTGDEIRTYSICGYCYPKLDKVMAQHIFEEDREYLIASIQNNILKTQKEKETDITLFQQKKLLSFGKDIEHI